MICKSIIKVYTCNCGTQFRYIVQNGHFLNETINISSNLNPACIDHLLHKLRMLWLLYNHFNSSTMFLAYSTPKIDAYFGLRGKSCYAPNMQDYQTKSGWIPAISSIRCIISEEV